MKLLCGLIFVCLSVQASIDRPAITAWSVEYNEHSTLAEYAEGTSYVEDTIYVAALPAPAIAAPVAYNEHSSYLEYVVATNYIEDPTYTASLTAPAIASPIAYNEHTSFLEHVAATSSVEDVTYVASLTAPAHQPFQGYWLDDPIATVAVIDEYNVGPITPTRQAAAPIRTKPARTVRGIPVDNDHTAAIAAAMTRSEDESFGSDRGFVIERGWGFRVPETIVHHVQAKDWW